MLASKPSTSSLLESPFSIPTSLETHRTESDSRSILSFPLLRIWTSTLATSPSLLASMDNLVSISLSSRRTLNADASSLDSRTCRWKRCHSPRQIDYRPPAHWYDRLHRISSQPRRPRSTLQSILGRKELDSASYRRFRHVEGSAWTTCRMALCWI